MRIVDPETGRSYIEKRRVRYNEPGQPRELTYYIHANPVRRGLVASAEDWEWSSARWYAGLRPVKLEMDDGVLADLARG
jgi:hypothetical protein